MTASNLPPELKVLGLDSFLSMTGALIGLQHCVARSSHTHAVAKLAAGQSGSSGSSRRQSALSQISTTVSTRGNHVDA